MQQLLEKPAKQQQYTRIRQQSIEKLRALAEQHGVKVCTVASFLLEKAVEDSDIFLDQQKTA